MTTKAFKQRNRMQFLWLIAPLLVALLLVTRPVLGGESEFAENLEIAGLLLVVACIIGRCWSVLYIGDHKNTALVQNGPYALTRNPLYLFSSIGLAGIGFMTESVVLGVFFFFLSWAIFSYVISREEPFLAAKFGAAYQAYKVRVPRFLPRFTPAYPADHQHTDQVTFSPKALRRTFMDALYFLLAFPALELFDMVKQAGWIPQLLPLY